MIEPTQQKKDQHIGKPEHLKNKKQKLDEGITYFIVKDLEPAHTAMGVGFWKLMNENDENCCKRKLHCPTLKPISSKKNPQFVFFHEATGDWRCKIGEVSCHYLSSQKLSNERSQ